MSNVLNNLHSIFGTLSSKFAFEWSKKQSIWSTFFIDATYDLAELILKFSSKVLIWAWELSCRSRRAVSKTALGLVVGGIDAEIIIHSKRRRKRRWRRR